MKNIKSNDSDKSRKTIKKRFFAVSFTKTVALGYFILLLLGTFLLMLPVSSKSGGVTSFFDALTTATSASCVTGLIVFDTFSHWSLFGQLVLLVLIQIGGLGYMTIITFCSVILGRRIGLRERGLLKESTNSLYLGGLIALTKKIFIGTLIFELGGAVLLSTRFIGIFGIKRGIYYSIFHSVSAFCNAGFDLMGVLEPYSSLTDFKSDPIVLLTVCFLIFVGGIGFIVWDDFTRHKFKIKKYRLHSKIALAVSAALTVLGAAAVFVLEYGNELKDMPLYEKALNALFASVTARTAGFNSIDSSNMTSGTVAVNILLMLTGGSPGSTAGGMKTTTLAVLLLAARADIKNSKHINVYGRRIEEDVVRKALTVAMIYFTFVFISCVLLGITNKSLSLSEMMFEVSSAIGTVGISCGAMAKLNLFGQMLITLLMYCGRVGSMSFALIFTRSKTPSAVMMPEEKIIIG